MELINHKQLPTIYEQNIWNRYTAWEMREIMTFDIKIWSWTHFRIYIHNFSETALREILGHACVIQMVK